MRLPSLNNNVAMGLFSDLAGLLFPRLCAGCSDALLRHEKVLCMHCIFNLPLTGFHALKSNPVERIFWGRTPLERASSFLYFKKGGITRSLLHEIKYGGNREAAVYLGEMMGKDFLSVPVIPKPVFVIPVPLHPSRLQKRGYNQSQLLAAGFSVATGIPVNEDILIRRIASSTQTKKKRWERSEAMNDIFGIHPDFLHDPCHLLLLDDVITTGSTAEACFAALAPLKGFRFSFISLACA